MRISILSFRWKCNSVCPCLSISPFIIFQTYEARIDALQKQVEEQSMTMSMYSSYTQEDLTHDDDIFCKWSFDNIKLLIKGLALVLQYITMNGKSQNEKVATALLGTVLFVGDKNILGVEKGFLFRVTIERI